MLLGLVQDLSGARGCEAQLKEGIAEMQKKKAMWVNTSCLGVIISILTVTTVAVIIIITVIITAIVTIIDIVVAVIIIIITSEQTHRVNM